MAEGEEVVRGYRCFVEEFSRRVKCSGGIRGVVKMSAVRASEIR